MIEFKRKKIHYVLLSFAAGILIFFGLLINYSARSIDNKNTTVIVDIPNGSSFVKLTEILNNAGMIKNRIFFYALVTARQAFRSIRAGEYEFSTSMTPFAVIDKLLRGEIKTYRVIIPEDYSIRQIADRLMEDKLIDEKSFFELAVNKEFLKAQGIEADSIEGYLFPETYLFDRSMSTRQIMRNMVNEFWKKVTPAMLDRANKLGFSVQEYVTLASIIGKESGDSSEKPLISAVFHNI
jgi:UPF0755 protein